MNKVKVQLSRYKLANLKFKSLKLIPNKSKKFCEEKTKKVQSEKSAERRYDKILLFLNNYFFFVFLR